MKLIFFADINTDASNFCVTHIDKEADPRLKNKQIVFYDPKVLILKKRPNYPNNIKLHHKVRRLRNNEFITIDFPSDHNPKFEDQFIFETNQNNLLYKDVDNYINTIQFKLNDFVSFIENFHLNRPIWENNQNKIIGLGNMCRIMSPNIITDKIFYTINNTISNRWVHFYGLSCKVIMEYFPRLNSTNIYSTDSTKWTRSVNSKIRRLYGSYCVKDTRSEFFLGYMEHISKKVDFDY
jgi:hypothetical protein